MEWSVTKITFTEDEDDRGGDDVRIMRADRWLGMTKVQFLGFVMAIFVIFGSAQVFYLAHRSATNRNILRSQERTIEVLCARGKIIDGLVLASIDLVRQSSDAPENRTFVKRFKQYHIQLINEDNKPGSPCRR